MRNKLMLLQFVKGLFSTKSGPKPAGKLFTDVLKEHLIKEASENNLTKKTIEKHGYQLNNIVNFLNNSNMSTITVDLVKIKQMEQLRLWLHQNVKQPNGNPISLDHSTRHLRMCREACNYAVNEEYISYNALHGVKIKRSPPKEIVSLDVFEVGKFERYVSKRQQWNEVRDLFLFQCFTGLSYMDLWLFNISFDRGIFWVSCETGRGKTKKLYWAEYLKRAQGILNKYEGELPLICNQTYNKTLKKIARELNVTKTITTHIGRKTFATLKRHEGYSIPAIAGMIGSTEEVVRKHYVSMGKEVIILERGQLAANRIPVEAA